MSASSIARNIWSFARQGRVPSRLMAAPAKLHGRRLQRRWPVHGDLEDMAQQWLDFGAAASDQPYLLDFIHQFSNHRIKRCIRTDVIEPTEAFA